jgi:protein-disulfide isomerase
MKQLNPSPKVDSLSRLRFLIGCGLLLATVAGCRAQDPASNSALDRKIETTIRNELNVPPEYDISLGAPTKSQLQGYNAILVTFSLPGHPDHTQQLQYLVSTDGNTLARLSKYDISKDPAEFLPVAGRPMRGNPQAKVTLVNFDDLECPFCARMHSELFPDVLDHYKNLLRVVYVDYPLTELHPWAMHAAVDANCLASQSDTAYWNFVDYVHTHGEDVSGPDHNVQKSNALLDKLARQEATREHLDDAKVLACVVKQDESAIRAEMKAGDRLGVSATPTFFVNGVRWSGVLERPELDLMIDRALRQQGITPPAASAPTPTAGAGSAPGN